MAKMRKPGTRKSAFVNKRRQGFMARVLPWFRRFGMMVAMLTFMIWMGAWFVLSDADTRTSDWIHERVINTSASMGFEVANILVEGRVYADPQILKAMINVQKGDPLFAFDPKQAKDSIEQIAWVDTAHVERRLPDTLYIKLNERKPLALWQKNKKLSVIDHYGDVVPVNDLAPFKNLVIVIGENAPQNAEELFRILVGEPEIFQRIEIAGFIADRRWDLIFKSDLRVKLPEKDAAFAFSRLARAQKEDKILDKGLTTIDLRDPQRMIVRTKPGATQEYQSGYSNASVSGNDI